MKLTTVKETTKQARQTIREPLIFECFTPLSMGFSRQEYRNGVPFPLPGDLPNPGMKPRSPASPALAGRFFTTEPPGKPPQRA